MTCPITTMGLPILLSLRSNGSGLMLTDPRESKKNKQISAKKDVLNQAFVLNVVHILDVFQRGNLHVSRMRLE